MSSDYFAHSRAGQPESMWEPLERHLARVADLAAGFASAFGAAEWARAAGLWHDIGKYSQAFQDYLRASNAADPHHVEMAGRVDHSTAGAQHAVASSATLGHLPAYVIAGHHSGLLDGRAVGPCQEARLKKIVEPWRDAAPAAIVRATVPNQLPAHLLEELRGGENAAFSFAFFTRLLFSCVVDADFLATEEFLNPGAAAQRPASDDGLLGRMEGALDTHIRSFGSPQHLVGIERARVREACLAAAAQPPGLFSLTVPTGGGKTLSSLAFALRHARLHGLRRVVYVAPFTTIIEQNADVFRAALAGVAGVEAPELVLEHHSDFDVDRETTTSRLATENWDAPLVVTTSVQFYESLFANRTSRCRKLHRLARAVIVLDEAQALPVDYLTPCLAALKELTRHYGSTVVLCTATQPAVARREGFGIGLDEVREMVPDPRRLYKSLRRAEVIDLGPRTDADLSAQLLEHEKVLCITNTRAHARTLFEAIGDTDGHYHLSALMVPEHRSEVIARVRARLDSEGPCRVVSTQLIEAGVDIDFPVVFRSLAGLDSIAQAAGRCNRNGRSPRPGHTYVFQSDRGRSEAFLRDTADCARQLLPLHSDALSLDAIEHYFRLYYWGQQPRWDSKGIIGDFVLNRRDPSLPFVFSFATAAENFRLIDTPGRPVVVPWGPRGKALRDRLRMDDALRDRNTLRALGRFTVEIPRRVWDEQVGRSLELIHERFAVVISPELHYSESVGLRLDGESWPVLIG